MAFRLRFPTLFSGLLDGAAVRHAAYWGACESCRRTTPWHVNTLRGVYRCTACGESPLGG